MARYVGVLNRAVTLTRDDPSAAAQAAADEFGIDVETAKTALNQVERLSADEQLTATYLGGNGAKGDFANSLWSQAQFLKEQGIIENAFDLAYYQEHVNPTYLEQAVTNGYTE